MSNYQIWNLFGPLSWSFWLTGAALLAAWRAPKLSRRFLTAGVVWFAVAALSPLGMLLIRPLEMRFARESVPDRAFIAVLAGGEALAESRLAGRSEYNARGDRVVAGAELALAHPDARVAIVGGVHERGQTLTDIAVAERTWRALGVPGGRIVGIGGTLDTCANALGVAAKTRSRVLLVTSAFHMPRAVACFRAAGIDPLTYPVDYLTGPIDRWTDYLSVAMGGNLDRTDMALHEWAGLLVYRLRGRTTELLPAPRASSAPASVAD